MLGITLTSLIGCAIYGQPISAGESTNFNQSLPWGVKTMTTIELVPISDIYADGVGAVEVLGGNVRIIYYTWEGPPGERNKVVVAKLVMPIGAVNERALAKMLSEQLAAQRLAAGEDEEAVDKVLVGLH
jgi:hypothetical protein